MEFSLMIIGVNHRTAPVAVRERFWMSDGGRQEALAQLSRADGVDEVAVVASCDRTEFLVWTGDASTAASSVLNFLSRAYGLKLCEWKHFYRKLDEAALVHLFRVASGLDAMLVSKPDSTAQLKTAWTQAQAAGTSGRFLDAVLEKSLEVARRVVQLTGPGNGQAPASCAAVQLARQIFGSLDERKVLLLGAGTTAEVAGRCVRENGATALRVVSRSLEHAQTLAQALGGAAARWEDRLGEIGQADVVISATACPEVVVSREEMERIAEARHGAPLLLLDLSVPRDIEPAVRQIAGVFLYDIDDLELAMRQKEACQEAAEAEKMIAGEARLFHHKLLAERVAPTVMALRTRLESICRQELEAYSSETGVASAQQEVLANFAARLTQRLCGTLARELKNQPEQVEQEKLTTAVQRLFHLDQVDAVIAGKHN